MKNISSDIEINASPEKVWEVLTDTAAIPDWNSAADFMVPVGGLELVKQP